MHTNERDAQVHVLDTGLAHANEEIARLKHALHHTQNELMQYAHIASHDLQEPLRKIITYSGMLHDKADLSTADKHLLDKIEVSASRMSALVADLLVHSELLASESMFRPVDLNHVAAKVIEDFELAIRDRNATIETDRLPVVSGAALQMNQLFYNLIDNALKFSDPSRAPHIQIRCKQLKSEVVAQYITTPKPGKTYYDISIRDNGIGFNVQYAEQILSVFKRLHPKDLYPGSGIGLSLCRNILEKHDGAMHIESMPGEGSAFHTIISE